MTGSQENVDYVSSVEISAEEHRKLERRLLWKLDTHVLPPLALLWLANFIDRTNIGNARIAGLEKDLHLKGNQFNTTLAVFYVTYIVIEIPSNWALKRVTGKYWLPFLVGCWGLVSMMTGFVHDFGGLVTVRVILGVFEGGMLPGAVFYLSTLYKPAELQLRIGIFHAAASLSGAFGGLLATAILSMDGVRGIAGWRWIFILEGIATIFVALGSMLALPRSLSTAPFLTEQEKQLAISRFRAAHFADSIAPAPAASARDSTSKHSDVHNSPSEEMISAVVYPEEERFEWREIIRGLTYIQVWLTGIGMFGLIVSTYSFSLFLPTIVAGLGYSGASAQLHTVPPFVPAVVLTIVVAFLADRFRWSGTMMLICIPFAVVGYVLAITATSNVERYAAVFLMAAGLYPCAACILAIMAKNSSGHYKRATTTALQLAVGNVGAFVATFAYTPDQAPKYIRGHSIALAFICLTWVAIACNVAYCMWENKARREGRRAQNVVEWQKLWDEGKTRAPIGDRSPDFMYVL